MVKLQLINHSLAAATDIGEAEARVEVAHEGVLRSRDVLADEASCPERARAGGDVGEDRLLDLAAQHAAGHEPQVNPRVVSGTAHNRDHADDAVVAELVLEPVTLPEAVAHHGGKLGPTVAARRQIELVGLVNELDDAF